MLFLVLGLIQIQIQMVGRVVTLKMQVEGPVRMRLVAVGGP